MSLLPLVSIVMDSPHDWDIVQHAELTLGFLGIPREVKIISAHKTPDYLAEFSKQAETRGIEVIIAGASGAAHLPGMIAAYTLLPVLGIPIAGEGLNGMDALLSMVQMYAGIPVGTLAVGRSGAINAALLAAQILARKDLRIRLGLEEYRAGLTKKIKDNPDPRHRS